ncbi:helix-turn-helix domain-containing protein [Microbispora sp. NBC_01389]|uniref:helix-turn-helix domain-containing protein n=1 Tax=Microbispora sp. NBC_01389 TaxID=2903584 RepID=UPI0032469837
MSRRPNPVDPGASPLHLFGAALRRIRGDAPLTKVGKEILTDWSRIARWERGECLPHADSVRRLDEFFGADGILIALHQAMSELERLRSASPKPDQDKGEFMERRALLQLAIAGLGMGALGDVTAGEPVRRLLDLAMEAEPRSVEDWHLACLDHLHGLRTRPPAQVAADLLVDLMAVRHQIERSRPDDVTELHRVTAAFATVHANALTRLGEHGAALRWWRTARQAADASGDLELGLSVRATETGHGLYGQRDPETVLRLTESAQRMAGTQPSLGLALVVCSQAKAFAFLGRHKEAGHALNVTRDLLATDPPAVGIMPGYWQGGQLPYAESIIYAGTGDETVQSEASEVVLALTRDYQIMSTARLHSALCTVVNGGVDEGARLATAVMGDIHPEARSVMTTETARWVLRAVPREKHDRPAVGELRELLTVAPAARDA